MVTLDCYLLLPLPIAALVKLLFCYNLLSAPNTAIVTLFFLLGFTPCKAEQSLRGMELQEKKTQKRLQDTENLFRKNLQLKDVC